jgi:hypothetical protein
MRMEDVVNRTGWLVCCALVLASTSPSRADVARTRADPPPFYLCSHCTEAQFEATAQRLGPGRHVLVDDATASAHVYVVTAASGEPHTEKVSPTPQELQRIDLSRRITSDAGFAVVKIAELAPWLRPRDVPRTTRTVLAAGALQNDIIDAVDALRPVFASSVIQCQAAPCPPLTLVQKPDGRETTVVLDDGGAVVIGWEHETARVRAMRDANGAALPLDGPSDFTHGKVYIFSDHDGMVRFRSHLERIGFTVDVPDSSRAIRCVKADDGVDCRDAGDWTHDARS